MKFVKLLIVSVVFAISFSMCCQAASKSFSKISETTETRKKIGHANADAKVWKPGDSLAELTPSTFNPIDNQYDNSIVDEDLDLDPSEVYFNLEPNGTFRAPKALLLENGAVYFKNAKHDRYYDEEEGQWHDFIKVTYSAEIYDAKKDPLHFYFVIDGGEKIKEDVVIYDADTETSLEVNAAVTVCAELNPVLSE